jgi:transposase-like protein
MSFNCEFCKSTFSTKSSLNYHQKTVKYCLDIQQQLNSSFKKEDIYKCEYCNKEFNVKNSYIRHKESCKEKVIKARKK